jgi:hypothetical protein
MSETNPYEAPRSELLQSPPEAGPRRGIPSDKVLATRLLEIRDQGRYSVGLFFRWNARRYLVFAALGVAALGVLAAIGLWAFFFFYLGLFSGMFIRDLGWLRSIQRGWPFTERVTDWQKVRDLAGGGA